jgi:signal transduction histidine kinase
VCDGSLILRFSNDAGPEQAPDAAPFHPRSLSERAAELGGSVAVERTPSGMTVVSIEIPV